jgi:tetratricopeptide (TPR) repeat protein
MYELPVRVALPDPRFLVPVVIATLTTTALLLARRCWPGGLAAWLHAAVVVLPVSGVVHAGWQLAHDRYSYLAGLGLALLGGAGVTWLLSARGRQRLGPLGLGAAMVASALVLLALGAGAWRQAGFWRDPETLWQAAVNADPTCALCHTNLGTAILQSGRLRPDRLARAEAHLREAARLRPDHADPLFNLGSLLALERRFTEAEAVLQRYRERFTSHPDGPMRLGMLYVDWGRPAQGIPHLREALRMRQDYPQARAELARALRAHALELERAGRGEDARALAREAATLGAEGS